MKNFIQNIEESKYILFIYLFIFFTPFYLHRSQYVLFSILLLFFWLISDKPDTIKIKIKKLFLFKPFMLMFLFILYTYLSLSWTSDIKHGLWVQKAYRDIIIITLLLLTLTKDKVQVAFNILLFSISLYALYSIGIFLDFYSVLDSNSSNPKGFLPYVRASQMFITAIVVAMIFFYYNKNRLYKYFYGATFLISIIALSINNSRSAKLTLILTLITFLIFFGKFFFSKRKLILIFFLTLILSGILFKFSDRFNHGFQNLENIIVNNNYQSSWGARSYMYITGIEIFKNNLLFGVGAGDSKDEYQKIAVSENKNKKLCSYIHMHNQHIEYLVRYGLVGYALFTFSIISLLYSIRKYKKYYYIGILFFLTIFYNSIFNSIIDKKPINIIFFIIFSLLSVVALKIKTDKVDTNNVVIEK